MDEGRGSDVAQRARVEGRAVRLCAGCGRESAQHRDPTWWADPDFGLCYNCQTPADQAVTPDCYFEGIERERAVKDAAREGVACFDRHTKASCLEVQASVLLSASSLSPKPRGPAEPAIVLQAGGAHLRRRSQ